MRSAFFVALAASAALNTGCSTEHGLEYTLLSDPPASVLLAEDVIEIPAGVAVAARVIALENDERHGDRVVFVPRRVGIIGVENVADEEREFVFWGMEPGSSDIDVYFDGERVTKVEAFVTEPRLGPP